MDFEISDLEFWKDTLIRSRFAMLVVKRHRPEVSAVGVDPLCGQLQVCNPLLSLPPKGSWKALCSLSIMLTKSSKEATRTLTIFLLKFLNRTPTMMTSKFLAGSSPLFTGDFEKVLYTFNVSTL